jgi:hypothetical protein
MCFEVLDGDIGALGGVEVDQGSLEDAGFMNQD